MTSTTPLKACKRCYRTQMKTMQPEVTEKNTMTGAGLTRADLTSANLCGADLDGAEGAAK